MADVDEAAPGRRYHHGDLPNALRQAALELIEEVGPTGFSLREVARRAGVSHAAPAHHFGDKNGLVTALAIDGFELLATAMGDVIDEHDDPIERLVAQGQAYVRLARTNRSHFAVMWLPDVHHEDEDERLADLGMRTFGCLVETIEQIRERYRPDLDVELAALKCWALVQGLSELTEPMEGKIEYPSEEGTTAVPAGDELVEQVLRLSISGMVPGHEGPGS
ncbi:MAG: TetR/AcrR family transcriptional regulator [Actinomycetota bacterium]